MPFRQLLVFKIGCYATLLTVAMHMFGHVVGGFQPENEAEAKVIDLATNYKFALPGGAERSLMDLTNGYSLTFAMLLATVAATGLVIAKRGREDGRLMLAVARTFAIGSAVLTVIALTNFFIIPAMCLALMTVCFAIASVASPT
jgi:hypothetical protein